MTEFQDQELSEQQALTVLRDAFPGWWIWRPRERISNIPESSRPFVGSSWCATRLLRNPDMDATVVRESFEALFAELRRQEERARAPRPASPDDPADAFDGDDHDGGRPHALDDHT